MKMLSSNRSPTLVLVLLYLACQVSALVPIQCVHNVTSHAKVCCPVSENNHMVCGGPSRGHCQEIMVSEEHIPSVFVIDDRVFWPTRFFKHGCQCKGNFYGVSCDECWFGWKGKNCDIPEKRIRKDIRSLTEKELFVFKDVVRRSSFWPSGYVVVDESDNEHTDPLNNPKWEEASVHYFVAFSHRYGSRSTLYKNSQDCSLYGILDFNHDGHYHNVHDFAFPYWDWVGMDSCDICTNKYIGAEGKEDEYGVRIHPNHPWTNMTEYCYEPNDGMVCYGCQRSGMESKVTRSFNSFDFADQDDYDFVLNLKNYFVPGERDNPNCESFHMALEGFCGRPGSDGTKLWTHNKFHNMIDGSMCCSSTATNDPIFILHHTFMDKLFAIWYMKHKPALEDFPQKGVRPGHCRDCFMIGFIPPARNSDMFIDHRVLGYDYDNYLIATHATNKKGVLDVLNTLKH
ncbi:hypothetical protein Ciccas_003497 [Cichlidogyrus casuarinus]|uniref:Tyrosinase copper-binding domain-containing protein n=1 Tax=Cichlidogyrus casuarinus TaxID=1844966 RepID=A0ABD2QHI1_9PLAT